MAFGDVWKESLTELSGGQRSLLALSLILAMLLFKPAPIYILDEVPYHMSLCAEHAISVADTESFHAMQNVDQDFRHASTSKSVSAYSPAQLKGTHQFCPEFALHPEQCTDDAGSTPCTQLSSSIHGPQVIPLKQTACCRWMLRWT